jgi:hypothetical protein
VEAHTSRPVSCPAALEGEKRWRTGHAQVRHLSIASSSGVGSSDPNGFWLHETWVGAEAVDAHECGDAFQ